MNMFLNEHFPSLLEIRKRILLHCIELRLQSSLLNFHLQFHRLQQKMLVHAL